jgi:hypothetical protein
VFVAQREESHAATIVRRDRLKIVSTSNHAIVKSTQDTAYAMAAIVV